MFTYTTTFQGTTRTFEGNTYLQAFERGVAWRSAMLKGDQQSFDPFSWGNIQAHHEAKTFKSWVIDLSDADRVRVAETLIAHSPRCADRTVESLLNQFASWG